MKGHCSLHLSTQLMKPNLSCNILHWSNTTVSELIITAKWMMHMDRKDLWDITLSNILECISAIAINCSNLWWKQIVKFNNSPGHFFSHLWLKFQIRIQLPVQNTRPGTYTFVYGLLVCPLIQLIFNKS